MKLVDGFLVIGFGLLVISFITKKPRN